MISRSIGARLREASQRYFICSRFRAFREFLRPSGVRRCVSLAESKLQKIVRLQGAQPLTDQKGIDFSRILLAGASAFNRVYLVLRQWRRKVKAPSSVSPWEEASNFRVLASAYPLSNVFTPLDGGDLSRAASDSRGISETAGLSEFEPRQLAKITTSPISSFARAIPPPCPPFF